MTVAGVDARETGPEDALVVALVHGALDRGSGMARIGRRLDPHHRVIRYDRRGYGRSNPHPGPFTVAGNVDDLVALLDGRPAVLVGHSFGGHVVLGAAARRPDLVLGVVVYEAPLSWEPWWPGSTGPGVAAWSSQEPAAAAEAFVRRMAGDRAWERLPEGTKAARRSEGVAFVGEIDDLRRGQPWDAKAIVAPVVVGYGTASREHHIRGAAALASRLTNARVVGLDDCGHGAHMSDAGLVVDRLVAPLVEAVTGHSPGRSTSTS